MNKFLKDLENELKKLDVNPSEIKEILADHKEMIEEAKQEGLNEEEINMKFGDPVKVAAELHHDATNKPSGIDLNDVESLAQFDTDDYNLVKAFNNDMKLLEFNVTLVSDDFIFSDYEGEDIQVFQKDLKDTDDYSITLNNSVFTLKRERSSKMSGILRFSQNSGSFLVLVPKGMKMEFFNYHTVSGDVVLNKIVVKKFILKSTNGDIELSNVNLGDAKFSIVNGDIEMQGIKSVSLEISLVNGDVSIEKGIIDTDMYIHSVSGDAEFTDVECKTATFKTVSGDIEGRNFYVEEISLKSVSGDVEINNDDKTREILVKVKKTISGDININ